MIQKNFFLLLFNISFLSLSFGRVRSGWVDQRSVGWWKYPYLSILSRIIWVRLAGLGGVVGGGAQQWRLSLSLMISLYVYGR